MKKIILFVLVVLMCTGFYDLGRIHAESKSYETICNEIAWKSENCAIYWIKERK